MYSYQKLEIYRKSKSFVREVFAVLNHSRIDRFLVSQLKRASMSIMLNLAEGSSRFSKKDRRRFFIIARGSAFECGSILEFLHESDFIEEERFKELFSMSEELSRTLYSMIKNLEN